MSLGRRLSSPLLGVLLTSFVACSEQVPALPPVSRPMHIGGIGFHYGGDQVCTVNQDEIDRIQRACERRTECEFVVDPGICGGWPQFDLSFRCGIDKPQYVSR